MQNIINKRNPSKNTTSLYHVGGQCELQYKCSLYHVNARWEILCCLGNFRQTRWGKSTLDIGSPMARHFDGFTLVCKLACCSLLQIVQFKSEFVLFEKCKSEMSLLQNIKEPAKKCLKHRKSFKAETKRTPFPETQYSPDERGRFFIIPNWMCECD